MIFYLAVSVLFASVIVALVVAIECLLGRWLPADEGEWERLDRW